MRLRLIIFIYFPLKHTNKTFKKKADENLQREQCAAIKCINNTRHQPQFTHLCNCGTAGVNGGIHKSTNTQSQSITSVKKSAFHKSERFPPSRGTHLVFNDPAYLS